MKHISDYPASEGWALSYSFKPQSNFSLASLTVPGVPDGDGFLVTIPAASANQLQPGSWAYAGYVSLAGERYQIASGVLEVTPNLASVQPGTDLRSPAKRALDGALVAWESVKLGQTVTLNGRTYTQHNLTDLIKYVNQCKADYARELEQEHFAKTGINPRRIGVRFARV